MELAVTAVVLTVTVPATSTEVPILQLEPVLMDNPVPALGSVTWPVFSIDMATLLVPALEVTNSI